MITQDDRHNYCNICTNRIFDKSKGILCGLTNKKADFINECTSFETTEKIDLIDLKNKSWEDRKNKRIENLTNSYTNQGYNKNQAENIANKIVSYEISNNNHASMRNLKVIETESKTFNLDKTIINNMGANEKDSSNILSKIESIESQKINAKDKIELGFTISSKTTQNQESISNSKEITQEKPQEINKNIDVGMEI
jgi:hypothetical protein